MAAPRYTLYYFKMKGGRAAPMRLAFAIMGVDFEDKFVDRESLKELQASGFLPYKVVPVLEIKEGNETKLLGETVPIMDYIINKHGEGTLKQADLWNAARSDEIASAAGEVMNHIGFSMRESDADKKAKARAHLANELIPCQLACIEKRLHPEGYASPAGTLSKGDLVLHQLVNWLSLGVLDGIPADICNSYERVMKVAANINNNEKVKAYRAAHPDLA